MFRHPIYEMRINYKYLNKYNFREKKKNRILCLGLVRKVLPVLMEIPAGEQAGDFVIVYYQNLHQYLHALFLLLGSSVQIKRVIFYFFCFIF